MELNKEQAEFIISNVNKHVEFILSNVNKHVEEVVNNIKEEVKAEYKQRLELQIAQNERWQSQLEQWQYARGIDTKVIEQLTNISSALGKLVSEKKCTWGDHH